MAVDNNQENTQLSLNSTAYEFDYFSGTQISMYIGDVLIDDLVSIQFQVTQGKRPIYGYASQYFDAVADGQIIVEGNFTINFKESDYLIATLKRYTDKMPIVEQQGPTQPGEERRLYSVNRENIERRLERQAKNALERASAIGLPWAGAVGVPVPADALGAEPDNPYQFYQDLAALPDKAFEDVAEIFEDKIWQDPNANYDTGNVISRKDIDETKYRRADQYPPIDIWILYGDISNKAANHTLKKLEQVHILGTGQGIEANGVPILEQYRFMAKNIV